MKQFRSMRSTWIFLVLLGSLGVVAEEADGLSAANVALREDRLSSWMEKIRELRGATTTTEQLGPSWDKFAVLAKRLEAGAVPVHELAQAIEGLGDVRILFCPLDALTWDRYVPELGQVTRTTRYLLQHDRTGVTSARLINRIAVGSELELTTKLKLIQLFRETYGEAVSRKHFAPDDLGTEKLIGLYASGVVLCHAYSDPKFPATLCHTGGEEAGFDSVVAGLMLGMLHPRPEQLGYINREFYKEAGYRSIINDAFNKRFAQLVLSRYAGEEKPPGVPMIVGDEVRKSFADRLYFASFDETIALHEELIETFTGGGLESKRAFFRRCRDEYLSTDPNYFDNRPRGEWYDTLQKRTACYIMMHHTVGLCGVLAMEPEDR